MSKVKARVGGVWQTLSGAAPSVVPPGAPTGVSGDSPSAGMIHLTWTASVNTGHGAVTNYVLTATKVSDSTTTSVTLGTVLSGDITGLANGAAYTCTVKARNSAGDSPASAPTGQITVSAAAALKRLVVSTDNARYFAEAGTGNIPFLSGSHTWQNLVDSGQNNPPPVFDYNAYISFLVARGHNFFRLWRWEQTRWSNETADDQYWFSATPWKRTGPGNALDGLAKFDLTQFNQAYFDRLRARVIQAGQNGIYVSVMLFNGWSVGFKGTFTANQPWKGHPMNLSNNINSINGDTDADGNGYESQDLSVPAITALQETYVRKVMDTVGDLPNVLYEISNESDGTNNAYLWQYHFIDYVHTYEQATFGYKHPVGMTVEFPAGNLSHLYNSNAEWISFGGAINNPTIAAGAKVQMADTDHSCGSCNGSTTWAWATVTRGYYQQLMDVYDGAAYGCGASNIGNTLSDPVVENTRFNMGKVREYAARIDLKLALPSTTISSTQFALAKTGTANDQYLVFNPSGGSFTVNLSASSSNLNVEWYNPADRSITTSGTIAAGSASQSFSAPFGSGEAVLFLYQ